MRNRSYNTRILKAILLSLLFFPSHALNAQRIYEAVIADSVTHEAIAGANAVAFTSDSSFIKGVSSDTCGIISMSLSTRKTYIIRFSMIGYKTSYVNLAKTKKNSRRNKDTIFLASKENLLKEAIVTGSRPDMQSEEDTTSFNAEEYNVPEGEALEELIKLLPGVEIDGNNIKYNGKNISELKINGKDFFKGKKGTALKNLPSELVKRIKTYEKKSDYSEQTGIDDGNEQTVMDIELKKELDESWITNYDAGVGSSGRYLQKVFANRMTSRSRLTFTGNMNDDDARSNNKHVGIDFNVNNGKDRKENGRFETGGHISASNNHSHSQSWRNAENYIGASNVSQFSNSNNYNKNRSSAISGNARIEWHPDTLTTVTASTNFSHGNSHSYSRSMSARFNSDPYELTSTNDPLDDVFSEDFSQQTMAELYNATINRNSSENKRKSNNDAFSFSGMAVHKFNQEGRNMSFDFDFSTGDNGNKTFRNADIYYYKRVNNRHTLQDQFTASPSHNWNYSARLSYSEPVAKNLHLQTSYNFRRSRSRDSRSLYELDSLNSWQNEDHELGDLPSDKDSLESTLNIQNSHYSIYDNFNNIWRIGLNYTSKKINSFAATNISYNTTHLDYRRAQIDTTLSRRLLRFSPSAMFRYRFSKQEKIELRYRGWNTDPAMTNKIPIVDNSDPLNIHMSGGNLKPSWNNQIRFSYNKFIPKRQQNWSVDAEFNQSSNNISTAITYDELTGVRTTQPKNINGNWSTRTDFTFSTGFGKKKAFRLNTSTTFNYDNSVGYMSMGSKSSSQKNTTKTTSINERLNLRYHNQFLETRIGGRFRYRHTDNKLRPSSNLNTYNYSYYAMGRVKLPWKMTIENEIRMDGRRGYTDKSMNTDELIWNARVSQNFFRGSPLIIRLKFNDILHNRSNVTRTVNAQSRVDTENDASYSYFMLHVILRLNIFNGKISSGFAHEHKKRN